MKAARVLCIIGLVFSLVIGIITIGTSFGLKSEEVIDDLENSGTESELSIIDNFKKNQNMLIIGFIIAMITGILGVIGPNKKPINIKPKYFCILFLVCVILLFLFRQFFPASFYIIAVILYFVHYRKYEKCQPG
jgi:hypothetical protein